MRQNPHVRICGGPGSATTLVYPTVQLGLVCLVDGGHTAPAEERDDAEWPEGGTACECHAPPEVEAVRLPHRADWQGVQCGSGGCAARREVQCAARRAVQWGRGLVTRVRGGQCLSHHAPLVELARPSMNVAAATETHPHNIHLKIVTAWLIGVRRPIDRFSLKLRIRM